MSCKADERKPRDRFFDGRCGPSQRLSLKYYWPMKPEAVAAASAALTRARSALASIEAFGPSPSPQQMREILNHWSDLLTYGNRVFGKLEQGAKRTSAADWFAAIKEERQTDPLLNYLHEARNVDDHGIAPVASSDHVFQIADLSGGQAVTMFSTTGRAADLQMMPGPNVTRVIALLPVKVRNAILEVPNSHRGKSIANSTPLNFAVLFLQRLEEVVAEARQWCDLAATQSPCSD